MWIVSWANRAIINCVVSQHGQLADIHAVLADLRLVAEHAS